MMADAHEGTPQYKLIRDELQRRERQDARATVREQLSISRSAMTAALASACVAAMLVGVEITKLWSERERLEDKIDGLRITATEQNTQYSRLLARTEQIRKRNIEIEEAAARLEKRALEVQSRCEVQIGRLEAAWQAAEEEAQRCEARLGRLETEDAD